MNYPDNYNPYIEDAWQDALRDNTPPFADFDHDEMKLAIEDLVEELMGFDTLDMTKVKQRLSYMCEQYDIMFDMDDKLFIERTKF
jgi:hypothetical protein